MQTCPFLAFVCPSLYFSASNPTLSKSPLAAVLSDLALAMMSAAKMLYLRERKEEAENSNVQKCHSEDGLEENTMFTRD